MSDQTVLLPKWFSHGGIILAKGQLDHSYTFWTMANYTTVDCLSFFDSDVSSNGIKFCPISIFRAMEVRWKIVVGLRWSTCPLVFCWWLLDHVICLKLRKKWLFDKFIKFLKMTIFIQNGPIYIGCCFEWLELPFREFA